MGVMQEGGISQKGFMVAVPTLAGAALRIVNGLLVDRIGPKMTGAVGQLIVMVGLGTAWAFGVDSFEGTIALGIILGFAGASFAVALPLASRWYPAEHQGTALGIAGMGNSGTVLAALFAPGLARIFGWNAVFGLAVIPLAITFLIYMALAKDAPNPPAARPLAEVFGESARACSLFPHFRSAFPIVPSELVPAEAFYFPATTSSARRRARRPIPIRAASSLRKRFPVSLSRKRFRL